MSSASDTGRLLADARELREHHAFTRDRVGQPGCQVQQTAARNVETIDRLIGAIEGRAETGEKEPDYRAAWNELQRHLEWMQGNRALNAYLGWNLAAIANDLIDLAYPGLREGQAGRSPWSGRRSARSRSDAPNPEETND